MRKIKYDDGVFNRLVGSGREIPTYDYFILLQKDIKSSDELDDYVDLYKEMINENRGLFDKLATLEDYITLLRIRENLQFSLYIQKQKGREYIYARIACPNVETVNRDIRKLVGRLDILPDRNEFDSNPEVLDKAKTLLLEEIDKQLKTTKICLQLQNLIHEEKRNVTV